MIPKNPLRCAGWLAVLALGACASQEAATPQSKMTFFVTSVNPGKGGDLGGLARDAHCRRWPPRWVPASALGAPTWRRRATASPRSTRATASAAGRGRTSRAS